MIHTTVSLAPKQRAWQSQCTAASDAVCSTAGLRCQRHLCPPPLLAPQVAARKWDASDATLPPCAVPRSGGHALYVAWVLSEELKPREQSAKQGGLFSCLSTPEARLSVARTKAAK